MQHVGSPAFHFITGEYDRVKDISLAINAALGYNEKRRTMQYA